MNDVHCLSTLLYQTPKAQWSKLPQNYRYNFILKKSKYLVQNYSGKPFVIKANTNYDKLDKLPNLTFVHLEQNWCLVQN